jgi:hypothetical protein
MQHSNNKRDKVQEKKRETGRIRPGSARSGPGRPDASPASPAVAEGVRATRGHPIRRRSTARGRRPRAALHGREQTLAGSGRVARGSPRRMESGEAGDRLRRCSEGCRGGSGLHAGRAGLEVTSTSPGCVQASGGDDGGCGSLQGTRCRVRSRRG